MKLSLRIKRSFPLRISSVNLTKSGGNCGFGHITAEILNGKLHFCVQCMGQHSLVLQIIYCFDPVFYWRIPNNRFCKHYWVFSCFFCFFVRGRVVGGVDIGVVHARLDYLSLLFLHLLVYPKVYRNVRDQINYFLIKDFYLITFPFLVIPAALNTC